MNTESTKRATESRAADLHYAFQFGQDSVRLPGMESQVKELFALKFADDPEAQAEFEKGVAHEEGISDEVVTRKDSRKNVRVIIAGADMSRLKKIYGASPEAAQAVMANTNIRIFPKPDHKEDNHEDC